MSLSEDESRPQPNGGLPAAAGVDAQFAQFLEDRVAAAAAVTVDGAECAAAARTIEQAGEPGLEVLQAAQEDRARRQGLGQQVVAAYGLQHRVQQDHLRIFF